MRHRDDEFPAREQVRLLPQPELLQEVPREHQEVVGLRGACLLFRHDGDARSHGFLAPLVPVPLGCRGDQSAVQPEILEQRISLGRGAVDVNLFPTGHLLLDEADHVLLDPVHPDGEFPVDLDVVQPEPHLLLPKGLHALPGQLPVGRVREPVRIGVPVPDVRPQASTVDVVQFHVNDLEPAQVQQVLERRQGVVFEVLVADVAELVRLQHQGEVAHLDDPKPLRVHHALDVGDELVGVLEVVEHGDARDDLRATSAKIRIGLERFGLEISDHQFVGDLPREDGQVLRRIEADLPDPSRFVAGKKSPVVAADIHDGISLMQVDERLRLVGDVCEGVPHRLVRPGPVPVVPVHRFPGDGVLELQEPASAADHQRERGFRTVGIAGGDEVGNVMFAQVEDGLQRTVADPAGGSRDHRCVSPCEKRVLD